MKILTAGIKISIIVLALVQVIGAAVLQGGESDLVWQVLMGTIMVAIFLSSAIFGSFFFHHPDFTFSVPYLVASIAESILLFLFMLCKVQM